MEDKKRKKEDKRKRETSQKVKIPIYATGKCSPVLICVIILMRFEVLTYYCCSVVPWLIK